MSRFLVGLISILLVAVPRAAAQKPAAPSATPIERIKIVKDFRVELLYSVPREKEGSWVSMCVDPKGRLIVSDQSGSLYRITPPALGGKATETVVEKIPAN